MSEQPPAGPPQPPAYPPQPPAYPPQQPGYPAPPGYPPQPGYAPPAGGARPKSGKRKTILLIAGGVVAVGLLGGLVGLLAGGSGGNDAPAASGAGTTNSGILDPQPVGQVDTGQPSDQPSDQPSSQPSDQPSEQPTPATPSDTAQPAPDTQPSAGGTGGAITVGGIQVVLPDGWSLVGDLGSDNALLADGQGSYVSVLTGVVQPTDDAGSLLANNVDFFVGGENYSDVKVAKVTPIDPFGSVVSGATTGYSATWVDSQGSIPLKGQIWSAIRQDGTALLISAEHGPASEWQSSTDAWAPVINDTFNQFGGS